MSNDFFIYLGIAVLGVIVTAVRAYSASQDTKAAQERDSDLRHENDVRMKKLVGSEIAGASFSSSGASMALNRGEGKLTVVTSGANAREKTVLLNEISSVNLVDHSEDYQHCQEMRRLRTGVDRCSTMRPYGKHSGREVKEGAEKLDWYNGKMVFGVELRRKDGQSETIPCFRGNGAVFWTEGESLFQLKQFVRTLSSAVREQVKEA